MQEKGLTSSVPVPPELSVYDADVRHSVPGAAVANRDRIPPATGLIQLHRSIERIMSCISPILRILAAQAPYLAAGCCWS